MKRKLLTKYHLSKRKFKHNPIFKISHKHIIKDLNKYPLSSSKNKNNEDNKENLLGSNINKKKSKLDESIKSYIMKPDIGPMIKKQPKIAIKRFKADYNKSKKPLCPIGGFSKSTREGIFNDEKKMNEPSPWTYNPQETYKIGEKNRKYTIKSKLKFNSSEIKNDNPGPGYYEVNDK